MPGFTEQQRTWKREIKDGTPEILFSGTSKEIVVSPAEQVRYKEHVKFGTILTDDLFWAVSQDQALDETAIEERFQTLVDKSLTDDQRKRLAYVRDMLLRQYTITRQVGRTELLHRVESAADDISGGMEEFRLSNVDAEDIEITPFGAIVITVRDRRMWEEELGFPSATKGRKFTLNRKLISLLTLRQREAVGRLIFVRANDSAQWSASVRKHELFHDLYRYVFQSVLKTDYVNPEEQRFFRELKNELIAYAISEIWQLKLCFLLNWKELGNKQMRKFVASLVEKAWVAEGVTVNEARARATVFTEEISAVEYHLCRLALSGSKAFVPWIHVLIASESVKELVYHLSHIPSDPIDAVKIAIKQPGGEPIFSRAKDLVHWASAKSLPVLHLDQLADAIRWRLDEEKLKDPSSRAVQNWRQLLEEIATNREKMEPQASTSTTAPAGG